VADRRRPGTRRQRHLPGSEIEGIVSDSMAFGRGKSKTERRRLKTDLPGHAPDLLPSDTDLRRSKLDLSELDLRPSGSKTETVGPDADLHRSVPDLLLYDAAQHLSAEVLAGLREDLSREEKVRFGLKESQLGWAKDLSRSSDIRGRQNEVRFMSDTTHSVSAAERFRLKEVEAGLERIRSRMEKVRARWQEARFQSATVRSRSTTFRLVGDEVQPYSVAFRFGSSKDRAGAKKVRVRRKKVRSQSRRVRFQSARVRFLSVGIGDDSSRLAFASKTQGSQTNTR
jgi:hypothetical protein